MTIGSTRTVYLVDSFSRYDEKRRGFVALHDVTPFTFTDDPNSTTPTTKNPGGPGIDLCDPAVMAPQYAGPCGAPVSLTPAP